MTENNNLESYEIALVHRWLDEDDEVHTRLLVLITDIPSTVTVGQVKLVINSMSKTILDGITFASEMEGETEVNWKRGYKLISNGEWNTTLEAEVSLLKERSLMTNMEVDGIRISAISESGVYVLMEDDSLEICRLVAYGDLVDALQGEKRITLRLPLELHSLVARAAYQGAYISLNSFCIKTLAEAIGYDESKIEEFEATKRKPGRPKKIQDSE